MGKIQGVRQKGKSWTYRFYRVMPNGKKVVVEKGGFATQKEASAARNVALAELEATGSYITNKNLSFSELYEDYITKRASVDKAYMTLKKYDSLYRIHLKPIFGDIKIGCIKGDEITDFLYHKVSDNCNDGKGYAYQFVFGFWKMLSNIFKYAVEKEYLKINPMLKAKMPEEGSKSDRKKVYSEEEMVAFGERFKSTNQYIAFKLAYCTGMRLSECYGVLWNAIDFENKIIKVEKQIQYQEKQWCLIDSVKTAESFRIISLPTSMVDLLKEYKVQQEKNMQEYGDAYKEYNIPYKNNKGKLIGTVNSSEFVNRKPNGEILTSGSAKVLTRISQAELGMPFHFHSLRHTHCTRLAENGVDLQLAQERLGHKKLSTTQEIYKHVTPKFKKELLDALEKF